MVAKYRYFALGQRDYSKSNFWGISDFLYANYEHMLDAVCKFITEIGKDRFISVQRDGDSEIVWYWSEDGTT
jgi:hypothetical protein